MKFAIDEIATYKIRTGKRSAYVEKSQPMGTPGRIRLGLLCQGHSRRFFPANAAMRLALEEFTLESLVSVRIATSGSPRIARQVDRNL